VAVDDLELRVNPGEFMTLLGPSGCGKTTVLRCVAGLEKPDRGDIFIKGKLVNDVPTYKRNIGLVFQNYALFPHMTIFENLAFGLKIRKQPEEKIKERVKKYLELIRLPGTEERYPSQLSGGQQQRIALARSVIVEPSLLLLDEPLSNLDLKLRVQMRVELAKMQKELGITALYVTHDQGEAMSMSDRVAVIDRGEIKQVGTPREIYDSPQDKFVAEFIGQANIFTGKIVGKSETEMKIETDGNLTLVTSFPEKEVQESVCVSVRPEAVTLSRQCPSSKNTFKGTVEAVEHLGSYIQYHIRLNNDVKIVANILYSKNTPRYNIGETVYACWEPGECTII
jgi:spermidine/putrescine ABC transporter ATP-binding subunit